MERRKFLASSLAASALAVTNPSSYAEAAQGAMQGKAGSFINSGAITSIVDRKENFAMIFSAMRSCRR